MKKRIVSLIFALALAVSLLAGAQAEGSYTVDLPGGIPVFEGPGSDYDLVQEIPEDGVYTIVEEAFDEHGGLWGYLKSGIGWVFLEENNSPAYYDDTVNYTMDLPGGTPIFEGPGSGYDFVQDVPEDGVYTIVAEEFDEYGSLWGKLKSGLGWVLLEENNSFYFDDTVNYTASLPAGTAIYEGPGTEHGFVQDIPEDGVFTIVAETFDEYGFLWGKLKSGLGWVCLDYPMIAGEPSEGPVNRDLTEDYTTHLFGGTGIYAGPGEEYGCVGSIENEGVYTITRESVSDYGFVWGRLKSGAGWVRLSDAPVEIPESFGDVPYVINVSWHTPVFDGPGYDDMYVGVVGEDGAFTIVEEAWDDEYSLWGRLKSGLGWINLTDIFYPLHLPVSACIAEDGVPGDGAAYSFTAEDGVRIAVIANEDITDAAVHSLDFDGEGLYISDTLFTVEGLNEGEALEAEVMFYGDMTSYCFSFTDAMGAERYFSLSVSGRNGSLYMYELDINK